MYDQFDNKIDDEIDYQNDEHWKNDDPADQMTNSQTSFITIVMLIKARLYPSNDRSQ